MFTFLTWVYLLNPDNKDHHGDLISIAALVDAVCGLYTVLLILTSKQII